LAAILAADFNPIVCAPAKLAAWTAFWSEAQSAPLYRAQCGESDDRYEHMLEDLCRRLIAEGSYALDAGLVARALRVTVAGLWLDIQTAPEPRPVQEALDVVFAAAAAFFPSHFDGRGSIVRT
ncbi:MAG: TetR family transcriptional regulator, partial [Alphaproteobacteria bacterium]|nr:TetR family transcriptional regulator [Alphaproteobacteria bacterium]